MNSKPPGKDHSEFLILPNGRILAHNLTPALARVLAVPRRLLIVDELSIGLAPVVVDEVFEALRRVLESGMALLIVEQHVERALELARRAVVLSEGRVTYEGRVDDVRDVASPMLGPLREVLGP